jgi:predicted MFS family arabinose efflux permease
LRTDGHPRTLKIRMASQPRPDGTARLMLFFAVVYAVEGVGQAKSGIVWQPLTHFLKEARNWGPVEISVSLAVLDVPWVIKPLYGLVSDFLPLAGYRRRPYLLLASVAASLAFVWVGILNSPESIIPALVVTSVAMAVASTVCGGLLVENGQRLNASDAFVNQQWLWFNIAIVVTSLLGGFLIEMLPAGNALRAAAWIAAAAPLAVIASLRLVREDRAKIDRAGFVDGLGALLAAFRSRDLWLIGAFLFCYYFSPGFGTPLYFELTDTLRFSQGFIGFLSAVTAVGWIAGGLLYRYLLWRMASRALLNLSLVFGVISTLAYLGLSNSVSAVVIYFFSGMAAMVANVATLSLAAAVCPPRAEGFTFAALMSLINLAQPLSDTIGAVLYEHVFDRRLAPLIVVSAAFTAFVLVLVPFVDGARRQRGADVLNNPPRS